MMKVDCVGKTALGRNAGGGKGKGVSTMERSRTFLINMYRSSGISGARPVGRKSLRQSETKQRHVCWIFCMTGIRP